MNWPTFLVAAVVAALLALAIIYRIRSKKKGKSSCGCGCSDCGISGCCPSASSDKDKK